MENWLDVHLLPAITAIDWLYFGVTVLACYTAMRALLRFVIAKANALARRTSGRVDDVAVAILERTHRLSLLGAALLIGVQWLSLPDKWASRVDHVWFVVVGFQLASWLNHGISLWIRRRLEDDVAGHNPVLTTMLQWLLRVFVWAVLMLAILANLGVNITAFVASLGVGGVAIALAVQSILSDLFASLAIGLDKPFEVGDFVVSGSISGTVERIGLKTTRLRSLSGEEIICGNTELLRNTIHNYKRMQHRRIVFHFRLTYDATPEQLRAVPAIVEKAVTGATNTRFDRAHFKEFGETGLHFEVVYFVNAPDFPSYMDAQQQVNLTLMTELAALGVQFALPTRIVHMKQDICTRDAAPLPSAPL